MQAFSSITYNSVKDIPSRYWKDLDCSNNVYFSSPFLSVFEISNPKIDFKYIVVFENNKAIGLGLIQTIELNIDVILKNIKASNFFKRIINFFFCNNIIKIMFHGNIFLSGEHGLFISPKTDKAKVLRIIGEEIDALAKSTKSLHAIFVKDFLDYSLPLTNNFKHFGYASMHVEPNMILKINDNWNTYDDYKSALKSKYRIKVNKADSTSALLTEKLFNESDFAKFKDELQKLYENTIANANFNAQVLNLDTYIHLREIYHQDFIVKAYFAKGELVGFLSALANNNHLDAHFIGLNYNLNKEYAIYPRILNDYVRLGIEKRVSHINFGRTASEIKTTIGASPVNLTCYIKHKRPFINSIIKFFINRIKIKEFKQHQPFKLQKEAV